MDLAFSALETILGIWTLKNGGVFGCVGAQIINLVPKLGPGPGPRALINNGFSVFRIGNHLGNLDFENGHVLGCFLLVIGLY